MGRWTHAICDPCWAVLYSDRGGARLKEPDTETCCFCLKTTRSGLYVRKHPDDTLCRGAGSPHAGD